MSKAILSARQPRLVRVRCDHLEQLRAITYRWPKRGNCSDARDPTRVNLSPLHSLTRLELSGCDLSTSAWLGLEAVRGRLRSLACHNSLEELWHLLAPASGRARTPGKHTFLYCCLPLE